MAEERNLINGISLSNSNFRQQRGHTRQPRWPSSPRNWRKWKRRRCKSVARLGWRPALLIFAIATRPLPAAATAGRRVEGRGGGDLIIPTRSDIRFLVSGNRQQRSFAEEPANFQFYGWRKTSERAINARRALILRTGRQRKGDFLFFFLRNNF